MAIIRIALAILLARILFIALLVLIALCVRIAKGQGWIWAVILVAFACMAMTR